MRILFIEDNEDDAVLVREMLDGQPGECPDVRWVSDLASGLESLAGDGADVVLLDLSLPDSHGLATFEQVRATCPHVPVVVLSGHDDEAVAIEAMRKGAQDYLVKGQIVQPLLRRALRYAVERNGVERALYESERRFRTLVEQLPAITYLAPLDDTSAAVYISPQFEELLGCSRDEWKANPRIWRDRLHPNDREAVLTAMDRCVASGQPFATEYRMVSRDGRVVWFFDRGTIIRSTEGTPVAFQGVMLDVTEQKRLESQLRQAQKMEAVGILAGGIAHDFRNQLTVIKGYAELLLQGGALHEEDREFVGEILQAAKRSADLTGELLTFGRRQMIQPQVIHPERAIEEIAKTLTSMLGEDVEFAVKTSGCPGHIRVDPGEFHHALINLAANARDAMPNGGRLTLEIANVELDDDYARREIDAQAGSFVMVAMTDTGVGMDAETVEKIFEPFFTTKGVGKGSGLGLAMIYGFTRQAGGHVAVESAPGRGATFRLYFPRVTDGPAVLETGMSPEVALTPGTGTILVAEDEPSVRRIAARTLLACGYAVLEACDGEQAMTVAEQHDGAIDLLLTDVVMPRMNGVELAARLTARWPAVKVLYMSGYADKNPVNGGLGGRPAALLVKPFSPESLSSAVHAILAGRALPDPNP